MNCPIDDTPLSVSSRDGVEIDFCPQCRGVWLDRGELDKIIDRASAAIVATQAPPSSQTHTPPPPPPRDPGPRYDDRYRDDWYDQDRRYKDKKRKRRSFLDDLFDFD